MNILITGGASGLGASIVRHLAADSGNVVYFTYAKSVDAAMAMEEAYPNVTAIPCDFDDPDAVDALIGQIAGIELDVLINNANGAIHKEHFYKMDPGVFLHSFEQDVFSALRITQEAIKVFRKKKFGKIVNIISSAVGGKPPIGWSAYVANKAYLLAMSRAWATECIKFNITSNSISPSFMLTNLNSDVDERLVAQMKEEHPLKRLLTTDEVADAVDYFVRASQQVNGINLVINAGEHMM